MRAANADEVEIVSASDTTAMPSAPASSSEIGPLEGGDRERREPLRQTPDQADPALAEAEQRAASDREHDHDQHGGNLRQPALQHQDQDPPGPPTAAAAGPFAVATPRTNPVASPRGPSASTEKPNSLGSWPTRIVTARPFM